MLVGERAARRSGPAPGEPRPRLEVASEEPARTRLRQLAVPPHIVIHEVDKLVALWRLHEPVDVYRGERLLQWLAQRLGGDRELVNPTTALIALPGQLSDRVYPAPTVAPGVWSEEVVGVEMIERWLEREAAPPVRI